MIKKTIDELLLHIASATLSKTLPQAPYLKLTLKRLANNKELFFLEQFTSSQSFHASMTREETGNFLKAQIGTLYKNALIICEYEQNTTEFVQFLTNKKGKTTIIRKKNKKNSDSPFPASCVSHNRKKNYLIEEGKPVFFLQHLGVMTEDGTVIADKYRKFKQINRFLEFIDDILDDILPQDGSPLSIVDFGCGKSYLTFAVYYYLSELKKIPVSIIGLDLKEDVISLCTELAKECNYDHIQFKCASIESYFESLEAKGSKGPDLVISLHACDTASDYALASAIAQKTKAILCVPCCQHELSLSLQKNTHKDSLFSPYYKFGLIRERFSSLTTDLMRALLLEQHNYTVQVLEFIDFSHTPKNILLRAVLKGGPASIKKSTKEFAKLKEVIQSGICLERLLQNKLCK